GVGGACESVFSRCSRRWPGYGVRWARIRFAFALTGRRAVIGWTGSRRDRPPKPSPTSSREGCHESVDGTVAFHARAQEVLAAADPGRDVPAGRAVGAGAGIGCRALHLHAFLASDARPRDLGLLSRH